MVAGVCDGNSMPVIMIAKRLKWCNAKIGWMDGDGVI
jgi:hypothetical protein